MRPVSKHRAEGLVTRSVGFEAHDVKEAERLGINIPDLFRRALKEEIRKRSYKTPEVSDVLPGWSDRSVENKQA